MKLSLKVFPTFYSASINDLH